eukprot:CAMPEP_0114427012 /NCGR_PEP_ID=MMETSP0103-20121206/8111_1 /TAXON_ID=37642 ORGANISM="Paraphysomonas imperforata, Strain PA2" /NCGR_SAMPLE_ID=MMETSP0103 /ASSEMBLY_ACC=CAM_ASM_000201 /LENGTH=626 /DNA_ID=CAMNT_0001596025 /DNA_START=10 /DNA_END=1886 /DNA_ORIENTATION=+
MYWKLPSLLVAVASALQVTDAQSTSHEPLHELDYVSSVDGNLSTTLVVDNFFYDNTANTNVGTAFWTRLYNADAALSNILQPGPVLKFKAGDTVEVVFVNNLGPEHTTHTGSINSYHYANKTNLHTHGLHVTAEDPQDNVLKTVDPQTSHTYRYSIPQDHAGGTFWYHAHHHGSTSIQVGGGLVGAIIVEDDPNDIPSAYQNLPEMVLIISHNPMNELKSIGEAFVTGDDLTTSPDNTFPPTGFGSSGIDEIFVNGQNRPQQQIETGKWGRVRMIFSSLSTSLRLEMSNNEAHCEWYLLAKDGIYVDEAPRHLGVGEYSNGTVYMGPGNRVDVVIRCHSVGTMTLAAVDVDNTDVSQDEIMEFDVMASADTPDGELPRFHPYRPDYLADVYTSTSVVSQVVDFKGSPGSCTINNMAWDGSTPTGYIETGSIQEWEVKGNARHPFHLHVNSYQLGSVTGSDDGFYQDGDWHDVVMTPGTVDIGKYVFAVDTYVTKSVLHCHFLTHEDLGCMGYFEHTNSVAGVTTGLTGNDMTCTGESTGTTTFTTGCVSGDAAAPTIMPTLVHMDTMSPTVVHLDTPSPMSPTNMHLDTPSPMSPTIMHMDTMQPTTVNPGSMNPTMANPGSMNPT